MFPQSILAKLGAGVLLLGTVWLHGCHHGGREARAALDQEQRDHRATKGYYAAILKDLAGKTRAAADKAKAASEAVKRDRAAADQELTHAKDDAARARGDLARALRDGRQQLQEWWACDLPGPAAGDAAADRGEADAAGRYDSAARIVEAADVDAAVIGWLWAAWQADRKAVVDAGCAVEATP